MEIKTNRSILWQKLAVFAIAFLLYANTLPNDFNIDDDLYTSHVNEFSNRDIVPIFTNYTFYDKDNSYEYRPVTMLSFVLQHRLLNDTAFLSHLVNLLLYAFTCLIIFSLLRKWMAGKNHWLPFFTCMLFIVHPLHTEIVNSIKSRDELLALLFAVSSLWCAWRWKENKKTSYLAAAAILFFIALLCKTTVLPYMLILPISFYFFSDLSIKDNLVSSLLLVVAFIGLICMRHFLLPQEIRVFTEQDNPFIAGNIGFGVKSATSFYVLGWYLWLHFVPHALVYYYGYKHVPVVGWNNVWAIVSLIIHVLIILYIIANIRKRSLIVFGAIFYLVAIIPFSNLILPVPGMMGERFTYSSTLGFCIVICASLATGLKMQAVPAKNGKIFAAAASFIAIIFFCISITRNSNWENKFTLYSHDMPYLDSSAKANMLYGNLLLNEGTKYQQQSFRAVNNAGLQRMYRDSANYFWDEAKSAFLRTIDIVPGYGKAYNNLGAIYFKQDSFLQAKSYLTTAKKITPNDIDIWYNLGVIYKKTGGIDSALHLFNDVLKKDSSYFVAYKETGDALLKSKDTAAANNILLTATRKFRTEAAPYAELANIALYKKDTQSAVFYCEQAAALPPPNLVLLSFLRNYFSSHRDSVKTAFYEKGIRQHFPRTK